MPFWIIVTHRPEVSRWSRGKQHPPLSRVSGQGCRAGTRQPALLARGGRWWERRHSRRTRGLHSMRDAAAPLPDSFWNMLSFPGGMRPPNMRACEGGGAERPSGPRPEKNTQPRLGRSGESHWAPCRRDCSQPCWDSVASCGLSPKGQIPLPDEGARSSQVEARHVSPGCKASRSTLAQKEIPGLLIYAVPHHLGPATSLPPAAAAPSSAHASRATVASLLFP